MLFIKLRQFSSTVPKLGLEAACWYPKSVQDLDIVKNEIIDCEPVFNGSHPTFDDKVYRARRMEIARLSDAYRLADGQIPYLDYEASENQTWRIIYNALRPRHYKWACDEYLEAFEAMELAGVFIQHRIP
jgi:hypothetical protein